MTITINDTIGSGRIGFLIWWTLRDDPRQLASVQDAAAKAGVSKGVQKSIRGKGPSAAWQVATQLGAAGRPSTPIRGEGIGTTARYLTRELPQGMRGIVREVIDATHLSASSELVATTSLSGGVFDWDLVISNSHPARDEVEHLMRGMRSDWEVQVGSVDSAKIGSILRSWLEDNHRLTVRGSGGVYFLPNRTNAAERDRILSEVKAMVRWVGSDAVGGSFSVVEVSRGEATTIESFVRSALDEVRGEVEEINNRLTKWQSNPNMNDGSLSFSAGEMVKRVDRVREKATALVESLGDEVSIVNLMLAKVEAKAAQVQENALGRMAIARAAALVEQPAEALVEQPSEPEIPEIILPEVQAPVAPKTRKTRSDKGVKKSGISGNQTRKV